MFSIDIKSITDISQQNKQKKQLKKPEIYHQNCYNLISDTVKQINLIIQNINADTDGCSSDLDERLINNWKNICTSYDKISNSMPDTINEYYKNKPKYPHYDSPISFVKDIISDYNQKNDLERIINNLEIILSIIEASTDVSIVYDINDYKIQKYEYTITIIILFMLDVTENEYRLQNNNINIIKQFYDNYNKINKIKNSLIILKYFYPKSDSIFHAYDYILILHNKWTKLYESNMLPNTELNELQIKFANKINSVKYTYIVKDMTQLFTTIIDFMRE